MDTESSPVTKRPPAAQDQQGRLVMKCTDLMALLNDYVDGAIDPALCAEFERHMHGCNPCQVVVDNIRQTITLYKCGERYELPVQFRQQLHETLRRKWKESQAGIPPAPPEAP